MILAWIIGTVFDEDLLKNTFSNQRTSGGWIHTQLCMLSEIEDINKIVVISVYPSSNKDNHFSYGKFDVFYINAEPISLTVSKSLFMKFNSIFNTTCPDIIDIQGTETTISAYPLYCNNSIPKVLTIHGVAFQCERFYLRGLSVSEIIFNRTIHDYLTLHGIIESKYLMHRRAILERKNILNAKYVRGRTRWDRESVYSINPALNYYHVELILRNEFYKKSWNENSCVPFRVFTTQMNRPYKGMSVLLDALVILKRKYPGILLHIPGAKLRDKLHRNGYEKLIEKKIIRYGLQDNIVFLGELNAEQMATELCEARVFVSCSEIENSPNSVAEAQIVGVPTVAALAGGVPEYIRDGHDGYVYNPFDPVMLAERVESVIEDNELSRRFSENARKRALLRHDPNKITNDLMNIYIDILKGNKI